MQSTRWTTLIACALFVSACSANPDPGSRAYKKGELGNGDFLFSCDDGAACLPYSNDAEKFPDAIATGSNFDLRFVASGDQGVFIDINGSRYDGVTVQPVRPYVGQGPLGLAALQPGYGTVTARDNRGLLIDYVTLKIVKPTGLVVYEADVDFEGSREPPRVQSLNLRVDDLPRYRVVAEYNQRAVAGSIPVDWTSEDPNIVEIESYTGGVVNLRARAAGTTNLKAVGAALEKIVKVTVAQ